jgi:hypothetical protein
VTCDDVRGPSDRRWDRDLASVSASVHRSDGRDLPRRQRRWSFDRAHVGATGLVRALHDQMARRAADPQHPAMMSLVVPVAHDDQVLGLVAPSVFAVNDVVHRYSASLPLN